MIGLTMLKIGVNNWWLSRSLCPSLPVMMHIVGPPSVRPRLSGSANAMECLVRPGYTIRPTVCPNPGLTLPVHINRRCVHALFHKHQSRSADAIFFVGIVCLPISMSLLTNFVVIRPKHQSSPFIGRHRL